MNINIKSKKRYRICSKFRFTIFMSLTFVIMIFATTTVLGSNISDSMTKQTYTEVEIAIGDNLWNLAADFGPANQDPRDVVYAIRAINELDSASSIQPGQTILIPTYI